MNEFTADPSSTILVWVKPQLSQAFSSFKEKFKSRLNLPNHIAPF